MRFRLRLILTISLLIAVSFGIGGTMLISTSFNASLEKETQAALNSFQTVQHTLYLMNSLGEQTDYESLENVLSQMAAQNVGSWQTLSLKTDTEVIYQSGFLADGADSIPLPEVNQCSYLPVKDRYGYGLLVMSVIPAGDQELELLARFDFTGVYDTRDTQQRQYLITYILVVLLGTVSAVVLSIALTDPLKKLTTTVRQISGGDLSKRSRLSSDDEFGQLSRDFDAMADKLQENISRMETEMQRQESFMGSFAHELKTPMTAIIGFADLLRQDSLDENTRMMAAEYIYSESHRLERLSFKLLDLILLKKDGINMKRISLPNYLGEVEKAMAPVLKKKGIRLICKADPGRTVLEPDLVKSLLYNLIDNAAKAMEGDGIIAVKAIPISGGCQFLVVDNGRGMEEHELSRITEAFYRVDKARSRSQGGAGLGLALCKQIAELHNGSISFRSAPGKGTQITVTLYGKAGKKNG